MKVSSNAVHCVSLVPKRFKEAVHSKKKKKLKQGSGSRGEDVSWCFEPSQSLGIISGPRRGVHELNQSVIQ